MSQREDQLTLFGPQLVLFEGSNEPMSEHYRFCDIELRKSQGFRVSAEDQRFYWGQILRDLRYTPEETEAYVAEMERESDGWRGYWTEGEITR